MSEPEDPREKWNARYAANGRGLRVTTARADVERTSFPMDHPRAGLVARRPSAGAAPRHGVDSAAS
jgi:hypothetical protein